MITQLMNGKEPTVENIVKAIKKYLAEYVPRIERLERLYNLSVPVSNIYKNGFDTEKEQVLNFPIAEYITGIKTNFMLGEQPTYTAVESNIKTTLDEIVNLYKKQSKKRLDRNIKEQCGKAGFAYEYVFVDSESKLPKSQMLDVKNTIVVFNEDSIEQDSLYALYFVKLNDNKYKILVFTNDEIITYESDMLLGHKKYIETNRQRHYLGRVPVTMYLNNNQMRGDYETVEGLILAYNDIMTDGKHDIKKTVDALLVFLNTKLAGATVEEKTKIRSALKNLGILEIEDDPNNPHIKADVKTLSNPLDFSKTDLFIDRLWKNIFVLAGVPDPMRTEYFTGLSGVAIKMQLFMGLEPQAKSAEGEFDYTFKRRLKMYNKILVAKGITQDTDISAVDIVFNHSIPKNDLETSQMIGMLFGKGIITNETLASQLSFVKNASDEVKTAKNETGTSDTNELMRQLALMSGGGGNVV